MARVQEFYVDGIGWVARGELLRVMIAAIYNTSRQLRHFTTTDVFTRVEGYNPVSLRKATAASKLVSVALRKAARNGMCVPTPNDVVPGDALSHARRKRVWTSKIHAPTLPTDYSI